MKDTQLAQIALTKDATGAIANPIYLSTAFQHPHLGESTGYDYSRTKNPTRSAFEEAFAALEQGVASFATSSGMAAINLSVTSLNQVMKCLSHLIYMAGHLDCLIFMNSNMALNLNMSIS